MTNYDWITKRLYDLTSAVKDHTEVIKRLAEAQEAANQIALSNSQAAAHTPPSYWVDPSRADMRGWSFGGLR